MEHTVEGAIMDIYFQVATADVTDMEGVMMGIALGTESISIIAGVGAVVATKGVYGNYGGVRGCRCG